MSEEAARALLLSTLELAVPMWQEEWRGRPPAEREIRGRELSQVVAERGDVILYRAKGTAEAFNALAEAVAILSFQPGGVEFLGRRWEAPS